MPRQATAIRDSHIAGNVSPVLGTLSYSSELEEEPEAAGLGVGCEGAWVLDAAGPPAISRV